MNPKAKAAIALANALLDMRPGILRRASNHDGSISSKQWHRVLQLLDAYEDATVREILDPPPNRAKPKRKKLSKNHPWRRRFD